MQKKSIFDKIKNKDGAALITVMVIFLTLVIVVTSATAMAQSNYLRSKRNTDNSSVYFVSESGIKKYLDILNDFYQANKDTINMNEEFAAGFREHIGIDKNDPDDFTTVEFGKIMGQEAYAEVSFKLFKTEVDDKGLPKNTFRLRSKGYLGDTSRITVVDLVITREKITADAEGYHPDSMMLVDPRPENNRQTLYPPQKHKTYIGPIVTNKVIEVTNRNGTMAGPIVTNSLIKFETKEPWDEAVIVTSDKFDIMGDLRDLNIHTIFLKHGASMNVRLSNNKNKDTATLRNIFIPKNTGSEFFYNKGTASFAAKDAILNANSPNGGNVNVYYYEPVDFDPYTSDVYKDPQGTQRVSLNANDIFGDLPTQENPYEYDAREYFKKDFVLDNYDNIDKEELYPKIVIPEMEYIPTTKRLNISGGSTIDLKSVTEKKPGSNYYYSSFMNINMSIGRSSKIVLDIGDDDFVLVTEKLDISPQTNIIVKGSGTLKIFLHAPYGTLTSSDFKFNALNFSLEREGKTKSEPERVHFYVPEIRDGGLVDMTSSSENHTFEATIFSKNLSFRTNGKFNGNFVSEKGTQFISAYHNKDVNNAHLILMPNGNMHLSGGYFRGVIIAQNIFGNNLNNPNTGHSSDIIYSNDFQTGLAFEISQIVIPNGGTGSAPGQVEIIDKIDWGVIKEVSE